MKNINKIAFKFNENDQLVDGVHVVTQYASTPDL